MKVSIDSVIDRTKARLGLRNTTMPDSDLEMYINEAAMHLDTQSTYVIENATLDVDCHRAALPEGFIELICMSIADPSAGCQGCGSINFNPVTDQNPSSIICTCPDFYTPNRAVLTEFCTMGKKGFLSKNVFDIQNGYIVFPSSFTANQIKIWYRTYNMDGDGIMVLDEYWQRGLSAYAAYMYAMSGQNPKSYPQAQMWQREWVAQVNKIRGKVSQRDHIQHKGIFQAIVKAILINPATSLNSNI